MVRKLLFRKSRNNLLLLEQHRTEAKKAVADVELCLDERSRLYVEVDFNTAFGDPRTSWNELVAMGRRFDPVEELLDNAISVWRAAEKTND